LNRTDLPHGRAARALLAACGLPAAVLVWGVWAALLIGYLGTKGWPFDLFANFRVQYLGLFAIAVIALTIARWRKTAIVALLGVALTTASMASYFPERAQSSTVHPGFKLITFNAWFRNHDIQRTAEYLENSRADVIILQEADVSRLSELSSVLPSYPHVVATPKVRRGVAIFSRTPLSGVEHFEIPERITRITRARTQWRGQNIAIVGAHLRWPLSRRKAQQRAYELGMIAKRVRSETDPVIVAGDFNLTPWSGHFARFVETSGLRDCALGQGLLASWPTQFLPARITIDHCFASPEWQVQRMSLGPKLGSDHFPLVTELQLLRSDAAQPVIPRARPGG
jgi:endonuclease/exonuclease/phosphatase (EEP) superfamily protein YafD